MYIILGMLIGLICITVGYSFADLKLDSFKEKAVKHKAAYWATDDKGYTRFTWKDGETEDD